MLVVKNISHTIGRNQILKQCSLTVEPGTFTAIVGPNGAGKTSLLKIVANEVANYRGCITLNGQNINKIKAGDLSRLRSVLPQHTSVNFPFTIQQIIEIGRYAHRTSKKENEDLLMEVMALTDLSTFKDRIYQTLSGGEQQRAQMARVMAQIWDDTVYPKYLLLDEPTSSLDLAHQHTLLNLAKGLCKRNIGVLAILHDLNLAAQYADNIVCMKDGQIVAQGKTSHIIDKDIIQETFSHPVHIVYDDMGNPMVFALPLENNSFRQLIKQKSNG